MCRAFRCVVNFCTAGVVTQVRRIALFSSVLSKKRQFFAEFFGEIKKNHNIGPRCATRSP
jgi:hypothetical protein